MVNSPQRSRCLALGLLVLAALLTPRMASAHGIWGHIHVTGWAIENLSSGEVRDFFADPEVMNAALFGAAFTDSGYWPQAGELAEKSREYSEHCHWEPFIEDFVQWIRVNDPPPWESVESRQRVAFLMGVASHGLQDEIFDSLFLFQVAERDAGSQDNADPGSDGFLAQDGHIRFVPERYIPMETLLELFEDLNQEIDEDTIDRAVGLMEAIYVNENGETIAAGLGGQYRDELQWTAAHYLDPDIPGSLRAEINPTAAYIEAIWKRLHETFGPEDAVIATYPEDPRRLRSGDPATVDSWVTFIFGAGIDLSTVETTWVSEDGTTEVAHNATGTRWGNSRPRLLRLQPDANLEPGSWWEAQLAAGATFIDGTVLAAAARHRFQVECLPDDPRGCAPIDVVPPSIDGVQPEPEPEPEPDAGSADAGSADAGSADAGGADAGSADAGGSDAGGSDATEAPGTDATANDGGSSGGCASAAAPSGSPVALLLGFAWLGWRRRERCEG
jgi:uncharacterized protein (TIGR03382 family)